MSALPARRTRPFLMCCLVLAGSVQCADVLASDGATPAAVSLPASMPLRRDSETLVPASGWVPVLALLVGGGVAGAWWWSRRKHGGESAQRNRVRAVQVRRLGSQSLTPQASVHAIEWQGEELLVACTTQNVSVLARRAVRELERPS